MPGHGTALPASHTAAMETTTGDAARTDPHVKSTDRICVRSRTPPTRDAGHRTANGREDPARYATDPTSRNSSLGEETLRAA
jgi:hypothetical protein